MKTTFVYAMLALSCVVMTACSDSNDEPTYDPDKPATAEGVFVLNQGSYYSQIEGSLTLIDYGTNTASQSIFAKANGRSLGATPQGAIVYGDKIYIAVYESNVIEIVDRNTCKSLKQISLSNQEAQYPRAFSAKDGKVYASMFNGFVARIDTLNLSIDKVVEVGPNPEIMAIKGDYLYVPNSDGMNFAVGYGTTASKINLKTFEVEKTLKVGLNPTQFESNGTDLFLLCKGNYIDVMSTIYYVNEKDELEEVAQATLMAIKGSKLYYIDAPYWATEGVFGIYDITTKTKSDMLSDNGVESAAAIGVDPINGDIVITSYSMENGYASYNTPGYAKIYDAQGQNPRRYEVGVGPCAVFFNYK